jgi:hypothetical protein
VPGGVDQVDLVLLAVFRAVVHVHGVQLDGDPALPLQLVGVQDLLPHLASIQRRGMLKEPIGQGGLSVVDVCDDAEITNVIEFHGIAGAVVSRRFLATGLRSC